MKMISQCHYCKGGSVNLTQLSATHLGKKIEVKVKCSNCMKYWIETWTLAKLTKFMPAVNIQESKGS